MYTSTSRLLSLMFICLPVVPVPTRLSVRLSVCMQHNDMKDLERLLKGIASEDKRVNRNALEQRRFIVVRAEPPLSTSDTKTR